MAKVIEHAREISLMTPSGAYAKPKMVSYVKDGVTYEEAHYYDPVTGQFIRKILIREIRKE
jgi:phospholipid N-methyltransferase